MTNAMRTEGNLQEILERVSSRISSSEARSLWEKMREEMEAGGPDTATRYLGDELDRCKQDFEREMTSLRETYSRRPTHE